MDGRGEVGGGDTGSRHVAGVTKDYHLEMAFALKQADTGPIYLERENLKLAEFPRAGEVPPPPAPSWSQVSRNAISLSACALDTSALKSSRCTASFNGARENNGKSLVKPARGDHCSPPYAPSFPFRLSRRSNLAGARWRAFEPACRLGRFVLAAVGQTWPRAV